ncbi:MAG: GDSL-type esterase/lipase family protein [Ruminococcus sp.]|nr:GDSL-type esterase/lipase family protein [Ruminococcus sp.]
MNTLQSLYADRQHVKYLGRTYFHDNILWLALSGSGVEFDFKGRRLELFLQGDDNAPTPVTEDKARVAVFINDIRVADEMIVQSKTQLTLIDNDLTASYRVRILKLSEAPMSIVGISGLWADAGAQLTPAPEAARKIEFIGDSITCGYGIDDDNLEHTFSTATEDVTKAYAYLSARALQADYSMVSYSGHGIISGYTESDEPLLDELVPPFYPLVGFSRGTYEGEAVTRRAWDFHAFQPDLIVLNLGTNDDSYCQDIKERQEKFASQYTAFLKEIRSQNPQAVLLCSYGIMNDRLHPYLEKAVNDYKDQSGDTNIYRMEFRTQTEADGYVVDYHPSVRTHHGAAWMLVQKIKEIMNW